MCNFSAALSFSFFIYKMLLIPLALLVLRGFYEKIYGKAFSKP